MSCFHDIITDDMALKVTWKPGECQDCGEDFKLDRRFPKAMFCPECRTTVKQVTKRTGPRVLRFTPGLLLYLTPFNWGYYRLARQLKKPTGTVEQWDEQGSIPNDIQLIRKLCGIFKMSKEEFYMMVESKRGEA